MQKEKITFVWREKLYELDEKKADADVILLSHLGRRLVITWVPDSRPLRIKAIRESKPDEIDILAPGVKSEWADFIRNVPARERMWYDCVGGIREALAEGLKLADIQSYRRTAFLQEEDLQEFYANRGTVFLMRTGNVIEASPYDKDPSPKHYAPDIEDVVECGQFWATRFSQRYPNRYVTLCFRPWYDCAEGIEACLVSFDRFYRMMEERKQAAMCGVKLASFYVYGRYLLPEDGSLMVDSEGVLADAMAKGTPPVLDTKEYRRFLEVRGIRYPRACFGFAYYLNKASRCQYCRQGWSVPDSYDCRRKVETQELSLDAFVGKTLKQVREELEQRNETDHWFDYSHPIRNDACIDLRPKYSDLALAGFKVNEEGFRPDVRSETDNYVIQSGDIGRFDVWSYFHKDCYRRQLWKDCQSEFERMLRDAGFRNVEVAPDRLNFEDPKNYLPEFFIEADGNAMKISWTDDGIKIEWVVSPGDRVMDRFSGEETQKEEGCIYALKRETAAEYLKRIKKAFTCCLDIG